MVDVVGWPVGLSISRPPTAFIVRPEFKIVSSAPLLSPPFVWNCMCRDGFSVRSTDPPKRTIIYIPKFVVLFDTHLRTLHRLLSRSLQIGRLNGYPLDPN